MKKNLTILTIITNTTLALAQCTISGISEVHQSDLITYTVDKEIAQCKDCHQWTLIGGNAKIEGDNRQNKVTIKTSTAGRQVLNVSILTPTGISQCTKNIDIIPSAGRNSTQEIEIEDRKENNCDIIINNYKEVKYAENIVAFFPNTMTGSYRFTYTVTYENGEQTSSNEKVPQFQYTKENGISNVKVRILSNNCMKEFRKTYETNYWKNF